MSVASASNDHRLGASEVPPAIVSMYIGEELQGILENISSILKKISGFLDDAYSAQLKLEEVSKSAKKETDIEEKSRKYHDEVLNAMTELRKPIDELEKLVSKKHWLVPVYSDILHSV